MYSIVNRAGVLGNCFIGLNLTAFPNLLQVGCKGISRETFAPTLGEVSQTATKDASLSFFAKVSYAGQVVSRLQ